MASKRPPPDGGNHGPPTKKSSSYFDPIGQVATVEEMDIKLLRFQNKKLVERIDLRRKNETALRSRIEQLETRLTTDDDVLMIVNRYWNQLDEDVRVLLQRFDAETAEAAENDERDESGAVNSFLAQLSTWDKEELDQKLQQRVGFSKRAIGKLLRAFDRLLCRYDKLMSLIQKQDMKEEEKPDVKEEEVPVKEEPGSEVKPEVMGEEETLESAKRNDSKAVLIMELTTLQAENKRLHEQTTSLHQQHHSTTLQFSELQEKIDRYETEIAEMKNKCEDLEYDGETYREKVHKLELRLSEAEQKLRQQPQIVQTEGGEGKSSAPAEGVSKYKFDEAHEELEEHRELASNRLSELETLQAQYQDSLRTIEQLKLDLQTLPEAHIMETTEYKCLKSQYSVLFNEAQQIKTQLEDCRASLLNNKNLHQRNIEQMESDELNSQKKLRSEIIQLEDTLAQVRKEYEMSRIELEQTLAANEQTGPINREMRNLITSLQNHNHHLKAELGRYKRKFNDAQGEITKLRLIERASPKPELTKAEPSTSASGSDLRPAKDISTGELIGKKDELEEMIEKEKSKGRNDHDIVSNMKQQLKKALDSQKEMKLLLDMYKSAPKEQKDKVQLMQAEKKAKQEVDELKEHIKSLKESEKKEKRKLADSEALKKIKKLEEQISELKKEIAHQKQEEEELLKEMELTGQAYEEKQEQNIRLVQQLKEKDDANFKLMSERIKSTQIHKLLKEEKELLSENITTLQHQVEAQNQVVRKLEEKERILQSNLEGYEKEISLRQQAMEAYKRKAMESAQTAADLKLHLDKYHSQLREAQIAVADKTTTLDQQSFKYRRITEELASIKKKYERSKKIELAGNTDLVLEEELREYKEQLTCPSCKVKKKDAVLTKCFHVFCLACLKTRYETRQRKCPKCNAAFGANDYHRIYIS